jgi:hypothetical protein
MEYKDMKISVPLTGTLISYNPMIGDQHDPVRPVELNLGDVSWQLISLDLERDLALIEVTPSPALSDIDKRKCLENIKSLLLTKSADDLYKLTKSPKLKKPKVKKGLFVRLRRIF